MINCLRVGIRTSVAYIREHLSYIPAGSIIVPLLLILLIDTGYCDVIKIGILANRGDEKCRQMWDPTADYLSNKLPGHAFKIVPLSFDALSSAVKNEEVDFLLANPSIYVDLEVQYGISRIATLRSQYSKVYPFFGGVIFTRSDNSKIYTLRDLIGKNFIAVNPTSLGGWQVALREFKKAGIDPSRDFESVHFSGNHESAIHAVLDGKADAGTANTDVFADLVQNKKIKLNDFRILVPEGLNINKNDFPYPISTRLYPGWPLSKLKKTPEDLATKVAITLLDMNADNEAARSADSKGWSYPLNYQEVHELKKELTLGVYKDFDKAPMMIILQKHKSQVFLLLLIFLILLTTAIVLAYLYRHSKLTEQALRLSENKFSTAFRAVPAGLSISSLSDGHYIEVNDTFLRDRGYTREDIIGHRVTELNMWVEPEQRIEMLSKLQESGTMMTSREVKFRTKTGEIRTMLWSAELMEFGGEKNVIAISQDITQLREVQEALRKSEEWYRSVIDYTYNWEYWIDDNGNFLYVSPSCKRITGYDPEDFMKDKELLLKIIHPDDIQLFNNHLHSISEHGEVVPIEFRIINSEGEEKWIGHICQSVTGSKGDIRGRRVSNRDITDRKRLERESEKLQNQLLHAQKMEAVGQLAGGIAHDFNNIISAIIGYGYLLQKKLGSDDPLRSDVEQILDSANRAAEVTRNLLAFSRKQIMNARPVNINEIISKIDKLLLRLIGEDIEVSTVFADSDLVCMADAGQIEQVLLNLATNARDAMPGGGKLMISTEFTELDDTFVGNHGFGTTGKYALIAVSDTGMGMKKEEMEKIFEPFYTTKETGKGTGLGLAMVYGIIKQHAGYIIADSEPGKGTIFRIYLPVASTVEEVPAKSAVDSVPARGTETILVAEDDHKLRKLSEIVLTQNGYKVILANDGEEAISKFIDNKESIQLVLLDMVMPKKGGKEVYNEIRGIRPDIKVIFLSGYTRERIDPNLLLTENINLIAKPVSPRDLLQKTREILDK
jgi:PAS domain S-box-containing protein